MSSSAASRSSRRQSVSHKSPTPTPKRSSAVRGGSKLTSVERPSPKQGTECLLDGGTTPCLFPACDCPRDPDYIPPAVIERAKKVYEETYNDMREAILSAWKELR